MTPPQKACDASSPMQALPQKVARIRPPENSVPDQRLGDLIRSGAGCCGVVSRRFDGLDAEELTSAKDGDAHWWQGLTTTTTE